MSDKGGCFTADEQWRRINELLRLLPSQFEVLVSLFIAGRRQHVPGPLLDVVRARAERAAHLVRWAEEFDEGLALIDDLLARVIANRTPTENGGTT